MPAPTIIVPLSNVDRIAGQIVYSQATFTPIVDLTLRFEWFKDGKVLSDNARVNTVNSFGFAALNIIYTLVADSGIYTFKVFNNEGSAESSCTITITEAPSAI